MASPRPRSLRRVTRAGCAVMLLAQTSKPRIYKVSYLLLLVWGEGSLKSFVTSWTWKRLAGRFLLRNNVDLVKTKPQEEPGAERRHRPIKILHRKNKQTRIGARADVSQQGPAQGGNVLRRMQRHHGGHRQPTTATLQLPDPRKSKNFTFFHL